MSVKAWKEQVVIPTYETGTPEKNPIFLEKRVYQGSSGVVYPYPVIESISDEKVDKEWQAIYLENEYIKVMILPELGGRVQMAYDKIKQRHFVYYNHVIKPALVGLAGPWISGGIEFNWPQHHRPSTYMPVDSTIVENVDGSVTVWVNEMERMFHQKGMAGFTLRPGCAYLEIQGRVSNRTPLPQTFLWWANPAVEVNDDYQSVFPPDVNAVFDHGKRAVSSFPIATGTYYKMDYSAGVDISNYKNIKVPTSYMAVNSKYNFEGGYENDTHGGMLHVASHHFSPGKKQWTWGNGDFGRAWDRNLTDEAIASDDLPIGTIRTGFRPYIELMAGVYTENQPDFTWLMPYEEKQFTQYFMPYRELGIVKQASKDFILNIEESEGGVRMKVLATSKQTVQIRLINKQGEEYYHKTVTLSPEEVFEETVDVKGTSFCNLILTVGNLTWQAEPDDIRPIPDAAEAALSPEDTKTNDQLYLTGLHLEQYRHATWSALDYYEEALRRDPNDVRCLNQTGLWYLRRGCFDKAETYLRKAVKIWQKRNPNPYDGEAIFNLALTQKFQGDKFHAYELFWKSTWNKAWADAGYFEAACISTSEARYDDALDELNRCLIFNSCHHKARALKVTILRKLGRNHEALTFCEESLQLDHFNYGILFEKHLLTQDETVLNSMVEMMHGNIYNYHELALDYAQAGLWQEAIDVLTLPAVTERQTQASPLTLYYIGYFKVEQGKDEEAKACFAEAEQANSYCCFPNRLEDVKVLRTATYFNPKGAKAPYYLGCLYYDKRQYDLAKKYWEQSEQLDPSFPTVHRNLALLYYNKEKDSERALQEMELAFTLDQSDARVFMELDQLYKKLQRPHAERLQNYEAHPPLVAQRDDLILEHATLLNLLGRYEEAKAIIDNHVFHPWEGGEGKVSGQYQMSRLEIAKRLLKREPDDTEAKHLLEECLIFPHSLGEGKLYGAQDNDFLYFLGRYEEGTVGPTEPAAAMYYNDAKPDKIFYAALAWRKLGDDSKANGLCYKLITFGEKHVFDEVRMDYFAVSLPDLLIWDGNLQLKNTIHCNLMMALGHLGLGHVEKGTSILSEVMELDINHPVPHATKTLMCFL
jgi:tetratricopeptide (TPR) repeat protein